MDSHKFVIFIGCENREQNAKSRCDILRRKVKNRVRVKFDENGAEASKINQA